MSTPQLNWKTLIMAATLASSAVHATPPSPAEQVDALNGVFGKHAGARASHAKGFCASAQFVPSKQAASFVRAPLFVEPSVPAIVRWSIGGGNPGISDKSRSVRGLAVRLQGKSDTYDLVMISEPVFFAATPESFVSFLQARVPDPATKKPDADKIKAHNERFPDGTRQPALLASHAAPQSYATTPYHANHAFRFTGKSGQSTWARVIMEPVAGTHYLTAEQEASMPDNFLHAELNERLNKGPVEFILFAQPAGPNDTLTDSSQQWAPNGPARVELGRLKVTALADPATCTPTMFVPTVLPAGVEPSADPILQARAAAYAVSLQRRLQQ